MMSKESRTARDPGYLLNSMRIENVRPADDDEIGVFTPQDICVGAAVLNGEDRICLAVWEDDTTTREIDGYRFGETFYLRYWDADRDLEIGDDSVNVFGNVDAAAFESHVLVHDLKIGDPAFIPDLFSLDQNYPNPFNSNTKISYSLPAESNVYITVFDLKGRLLKELVNARQSAGSHEVIWDSRKTDGIGVSSGSYFYRMRTTTDHGTKYVTVRQMSLIK